MDANKKSIESTGDAASASSPSNLLANDVEISGEKLSENFELIEKIADGAAATVYKGRHKLLGDLVAIKILKQKLPNQDSAVQRFRREAQLASQLNHPNIVKVKGFGLSTEGRAFIVMQYCPGITLEVRLQQAPLSKALALKIIQQVAFALEAAHSAGIVHRDIKPANIILEKLAEEDARNPYEVKLLDFGVAKAYGEDAAGIVDGEIASPLTQVNEILGTPAYMSPEQCRSQTADARSDIYSLGCVLFECCTGRKPFVADSPLAVMDKHLREPPEFHNSDRIGATLKKLIMTCLNKEPGKRYQSSTEFLKALAYCQKIYGRKNSSMQSMTPVLMIVILLVIPLFSFIQHQKERKKEQSGKFDFTSSPFLSKLSDDNAKSEPPLREPHVIASALRTGHMRDDEESFLARAMSLRSGKTTKKENVGRAEFYFEQAAALAVKEGNLDLAAKSDLELGKMYYASKQYDNADKALRKSRDFSHNASNPLFESDALRYLALVALAKGDFPTTIKYRQSALKLYASDFVRTGQLRREIAECYLLMGEANKSLELVTQNIAVRIPAETARTKADLECAFDHAELAKIYLVLKDNNAARKAAEVVVSMSEKNQRGPRYAMAILNMSEEFFKMHDYDYSLKLAEILSKFKAERISTEEKAAAQRLIVACNAMLKNGVKK